MVVKSAEYFSLMMQKVTSVNVLLLLHIPALSLQRGSANLFYVVPRNLQIGKSYKKLIAQFPNVRKIIRFNCSPPFDVKCPKQ